MSDKKTLILIDGHALAFRQYYALERTGLKNADNEPTWAVYGFFKAIFDFFKADAVLNPDVHTFPVTFNAERQRKRKRHVRMRVKALRIPKRYAGSFDGTCHGTHQIKMRNIFCSAVFVKPDPNALHDIHLRKAYSHRSRYIFHGS